MMCGIFLILFGEGCGVWSSDPNKIRCRIYIFHVSLRQTHKYLSWQYTGENKSKPGWWKQPSPSAASEIMEQTLLVASILSKYMLSYRSWMHQGGNWNFQWFNWFLRYLDWAIFTSLLQLLMSTLSCSLHTYHIFGAAVLTGKECFMQHLLQQNCFDFVQLSI